MPTEFEIVRSSGKTGSDRRTAKTVLLTLTGPPFDQQLKPTVGHFTLAARSQSARLDIERKGLLSEGTCIGASSSRFSAQWQSGRSLRRRSERRLFASVFLRMRNGRRSTACETG